MRKFVLALLALMLTASFSMAQLTGVKSIPGDYPNIEAAIAALNSVGVGAGGVTFNVAAGHTETISNPAAGTITTLTSSAANPIIFQKSGVGANPLITASAAGTIAASTTLGADGDAIITIAGGNGITFDGIDLQENATATGNAMMEYGYILKKASGDDACKNITIKNCNISLDKATRYSWGVYVSNLVGSSAATVTSTGGRHENIKIFNNNFSNLYGGVQVRGFLAVTPFDFYDQNIEIGVDGGNTFTNFGGGASTAYAIYTIYANNVKIANNTINGGTGTTTTLYGIFNSTGTNSNVDIYGNTVTIHGGGTTSTIYAINNAMGSTGTDNTVNIYDNIVENCSYQPATSGAWYLLYNTASAFNVNVYDNIVRNNNKPGTGSSYLLYVSSGGANGFQNIYNNQIHNNSSTGTSGTMYGIYSSGVTTSTKSIYDNLVYSNSTGATNYGIYHASALTADIYRNKIYDIESTTTSTSSSYGIFNSSGTTVNYYNNYVYNIRAVNSTNTTTGSCGIYLSGGTNINAYYNTVLLDYTSTLSTNNSAALYVGSTTPTLVDIRNNIFANKVNVTAGGTAMAFRKGGTGITNLSTDMNHNLYFTGTPGANNLIYYDGTNADQTLAEYKARVSPVDAAAITENPPFVSGVFPYDLHINTAVATQIESGGVVVATPVNITEDYDGNARFPNAGYPDNVMSPATAPDIGADEFGGMGVDITPPTIAFTPLGNTAQTTDRILVTTITDASGVPTTGLGLPRLYYRVNGGAYTGVTSLYLGGDEYSFTFGAGVVLGDVVEYYVVAQDQNNPRNIGANPSGGASGFTANPPAASTPPTTPYSYTVVGSIGGNVTVGTGGDYPNLTGLTGLFQAINNNVVSTHIVATIISDLTETGDVALNQWSEDGVGGYSLNIVPDGSVVRSVSGDFAGGLIRLNGADRVNVDGRFNDAGQYLMFVNNSSSANSSVFQLMSLGIGQGATDNTIRNTKIMAGANNVTTTYGIFVAGTAHTSSGTGADNDNLSIIDNHISRCYYGINARGIGTTGELEGLVISGNIIGSDVVTDYVTGYGMYLIAVNGGLIEDNKIYNMIYNGSKYGIYMSSNISNTAFVGNEIHTFSQDNTSAYYAIGMYFASSTGASNNVIKNNVIYDLYYHGSTSNFYNAGIRIVGGSDYKIYNNTISISGTFGNTATGLFSHCLFISTSSSNMDIRNNIFSNTRQGTDPKSYTVYAVTGTTFANINYNDYYSTGAAIGFFGSEVADFAAWQAATGQDGSSKNVDPLFVNPVSDLTPANAALDNTGMFLVDVPYDFNNVLRTNPPDIGAIEFGNNPTITTGVAGLDCLDATLNGVANANGLVVDLFFDYGLTTGFGSVVNAAPAQVTGNTDTDVTAGLAGLTANTTYYYRLRGVTTGGLTVFGETQSFTTGTLSAPTATTLAASPIGNTTATMNGTVNAGCDATTVTFEWGETLAYGNVIADSQSPVSGGNDVAVSADLIGLQINTTYNYRVVATNTQGTTYGANVSFQTGASPPTVVTNAATNIGNFAARLNSTVNANNQTTTTSFEWGATPAYGNVIAGVPLTVDGNTNQAVYADISGLNYNTMYYFRAVGQNTAGTTYGDQLTFMTLCPTPEPAGTITGPTSVCQATDGHVYTVPAILYATGYDWTLPAGGTIVAGANTNSITVSYDATAVSGNVTVQGTNVCGSGTASSLAVTINPIPVPTITGDDMVCLNDTESYATQTGMTGYVWTVSAGGQILSGQGTSQVSVKWNNMGAQYVTVTYTNAAGCPAAAPTMLDVEVSNNPVPTIAGNTAACQLSDENHVFTTEEGFSNYVWTVTSGGTIVEGQGTFQIQVYWTGSGNQTVTVNYENASGCEGTTPGSFAVNVLPLPAAAGSISGTALVCLPSENLVYSVAPVANAEMYYWAVPFGVTIVDGIGTNSITVSFAADAEDGVFSVYATNGCGEGVPSPNLAVTIGTKPAKPVVTLNEYDLTSNAPEGNQWYFEGELIEDATDQTYTATETGNYWTVVTLDGCSSDASEPVYVLITGLNENADGRFTIHPVPNDGQFTVTLRSLKEVTWDVTVYNNLGVAVHQIRDLRVNGTVSEQITLQNPAKGTYTVVFSNNNEQVIRKVLVSK